MSRRNTSHKRKLSIVTPPYLLNLLKGLCRSLILLTVSCMSNEVECVMSFERTKVVFQTQSPIINKIIIFLGLLRFNMNKYDWVHIRP